MTSDSPLFKKPANSIAIYVHIPYCTTKCPYCDFNSYAIIPSTDKAFQNRFAEFQEQKYADALIAELRYQASNPGWNARSCHSLFFGGGTPSLFSAEQLNRIITAIFSHFPPTQNVEVTIEANPSTLAEQIEHDKLAELKMGGVNRISVGAQSFNAGKLKSLGRLHSAKDISSSIANIAAAGFSNYNIDLISGTPGETKEIWINDLTEAIRLSPTHISCYSLTIEPGTEFSVLLRKGKFAEATEEDQAEAYFTTQRILTNAGYYQYEISNFCLPSFECIHNLSYWCWDDYLSLGAGAHSFLKSNSPSPEQTAKRWANIPRPAHYIQRALNGGDCAQNIEVVDPKQAELEYLMCHIRLATGVNLAKFKELFATDFINKYQEVIRPFADRNLLQISDSRVRITPAGFIFCDELLAQLVRSVD